MTKNFPEVKCIWEPDQDWGTSALGFCSQLGLVWEGGSVGKAKDVSELPPTQSPLSGPPNDYSHLNQKEFCSITLLQTLGLILTFSLPLHVPHPKHRAGERLHARHPLKG